MGTFISPPNTFTTPYSKRPTLCFHKIGKRLWNQLTKDIPLQHSAPVLTQGVRIRCCPANKADVRSRCALYVEKRITLDTERHGSSKQMVA